MHIRVNPYDSLLTIVAIRSNSRAIRIAWFPLFNYDVRTGVVAWPSKKLALWQQQDTKSLTLDIYPCLHLYPCRARSDLSRCLHRGLYHGDLCLLDEW